MNRLQGKVALITGATKGIGKGIAQVFLDEGATVVISSRSQLNIDTALQDFNSPQAAGFACNVTDYASVERLVAQTVERFGKLDVLINNAGVAEAFCKIIDAPVEAWYAPIETNLKGTYHGCRAALPYFLKQGFGKIINLAGSGSGNAKYDNTACISGYGSSKAAIRRLTFALAQEYERKGIEIMLLNPGLVRTEMTSTRNPGPDLKLRLAGYEIVRDIFCQPPTVAGELAVQLAVRGKNGAFRSALSAWRSRGLLLSYPFRRWLNRIDRTEY